MSAPVVPRALSERLLKDDGSDTPAFLNREGIPLMRDMRYGLNAKSGRSDNSYQHAGGSSLEAWYVAGFATTGGGTDLAAHTADVLRAVPFIAPARPSTVDRLAFEVTTAVAGNGRVGLWENTSDDNLYPSNLLVDGGAVSTGTTGVKSATVSVPLISGQLYWLSYLSSSAATIRSINASYCSNVLGKPSTLGNVDNLGISVAFTYADLPSEFPEGGAYFTSGPPMLAYRTAFP